MRLLRDPAPADGNGTPPPAPAAATPPAPAQAQPTSPPQPPEPTKIHLSVEEYQQFTRASARLAEIEAENRRQAEAKEQERLRIMAEKGQAEQALNTLREAKEVEIRKAEERYATLEQKWLGEKKAVTIAGALDGVKPLSAVAAQQMKQLIDLRLIASLDANGQPLVKDAATGRPAAEYIKEAIASGEFDHFLEPGSRGGAGAAGTHRPEPARTPVSPIAQQLRNAIARQQDEAPGLAGTYGRAN